MFPLYCADIYSIMKNMNEDKINSLRTFVLILIEDQKSVDLAHSTSSEDDAWAEKNAQDLKNTLEELLK